MWIHVALSLQPVGEDINAVLYINGEAKGFGLIQGALQSQATTSIGMMNNHQYAFTGKMFQLLVRLLSHTKQYHRYSFLTAFSLQRASHCSSNPQTVLSIPFIRILPPVSSSLLTPSPLVCR